MRAATAADALIEPRVGGAIKLFNGSVEGSIVELVRASSLSMYSGSAVCNRSESESFMPTRRNQALGGGRSRDWNPPPSHIPTHAYAHACSLYSYPRGPERPVRGGEGVVSLTLTPLTPVMFVSG
jgi:hypothetical protein